MKTSRRMASTLPFALALTTAALAAGQAMNADSPAVEKLKAKLPSTAGFEVKNVRATSDGTSCITYVVDNGNGGTSQEQAVVEGDKVLRSTTGNTRFASAWNKKCAKAD
jgi:hypothetical protein